MNVYLVELPVGEYTYGDDYAMVVIAENVLGRTENENN